MNSVLIILFAASLMITVSLSYHVVEKQDFESMNDLKFLKECSKELNLTKYNFTVAYLRSIGLPNSLDEGCLLDCYFFKMGQIKKKQLLTYMEHKFVGQPPKSGTDLTNKTQTYKEKVAKAETDCGKFLKMFRFEECLLVSQYRYCVAKVMNGTRLPLLIDDIGVFEED
ncbi:uncharacterized protein LOC135833268 [Planococcus citri]|uniref:uncharacterized protein LOC135833268 n=1 Tax=Planococcus citri TaxID=170843 RepID=UPI0031FA40E8